MYPNTIHPSLWGPRVPNIGKEFTLNGDPVYVALFIDDNRDGLSDSEIEAIHAMKVGEEISYGGGAGPIFILKRTA